MAATTVNIHEAKTHLSRLILRVEAGEEIIIARAGKPAVRMLSAAEPAHLPARRLGFMEGMGFHVPNDFNEMGRVEIEKMFHGKSEKTTRKKLARKTKNR